MVWRKPQLQLQSSQKAALYYHSIFNYPLTKSELFKWKLGKKDSLKIVNSELEICFRDNFYFLKEQAGMVAARLQRERISHKKLKIAKKASILLKKIPTIKFIGITGSLAMMNAKKSSDIDLMLITQKDTLWITRLLAYFALIVMRYALRHPDSKDEKDRLCLNIWLDEEDLVWQKRNIFTAHELAQIIPLVNKDNTYERLLSKNKWILSYWPNSVKIRSINAETENKFEKLSSNNLNLNIISNFVLHVSNFIAFKAQYLYMKPKITREVITPTRALFHPNDWTEKLKKKLGI
jgi:predicted nucleotidyltransferase